MESTFVHTIDDSQQCATWNKLALARVAGRRISGHLKEAFGVSGMPPSINDVDCNSSMSRMFNSLVSSSINTLSPLCNDSAVYPAEKSMPNVKKQPRQAVTARNNKVIGNPPAYSSRKPPRAPAPSSSKS